VQTVQLTEQPYGALLGGQPPQRLAQRLQLRGNLRRALRVGRGVTGYVVVGAAR
jgi:hypothetical protein